MHVGKSYKLSDFLIWTRRKLYILILLGTLPVVLYHVLGIKWLVVPWTVVSLLGTATAFIVGFKNTQTYNRTWHGHEIWGNIDSSSRAWGIMCRDYLQDATKIQLLLQRHFAWLAVLRYHLREERVWEVADNRPNAEYQKYYTIPERQTTLEEELSKYLSAEEQVYISGVRNKASQLLALQNKTVKDIYDEQTLIPLQFQEMQRSLNTLYSLQGQCEAIKETPYPRQYSIIHTLFVRIFCVLLPFGMLQEFDKLDNLVTGMMKGHMIWLVIPFSVLISWMYTSLEQVGESTENPFEGSPNDVPISQICRNIEIDLREMMGEKELPPPIKAQNDILV
ncbi:bestrophin family protein [Chitinophaga filiformis]|uniref:Putative membrane protein n=1 Tax=Chitinophaga filiformis TaxID=104663 RepID=A0A1G7H445_CHIFI|nr:bestrophin family ion channel [Chitinophaga filiformis]SDE94899.1 putative membrane protein [Chitinophaga filiformis]